MTRAAVFLLILLIVFLAFAQFVRRTGMFFPDRYPNGLWDVRAWPVVPTDHFFHASDGVKLHGWWFRADANAPVLVWCHGNGGNLTHRAEMASELARRGVSVFLFDYRGFGRSDGSVSESGSFLDSLAAYDYVRQQTTQPIALYGESIGGPFAAYVAKERKPVRAVIIENSFPSLMDLGNALYKLGWTAPFAMRTTAWLNEAGAPVLVMHGTADEIIPYALGRKLYDGLRVPKELMTVEAGHSMIPAAEPVRYYDTVTRFVKAGGPR